MTPSAISENISRWYAVHGRRDLPWRQTVDPYRIYVSEIMLQQTQVKTVLERFYLPFLEAFPTLSALADAQEEAVLKRWQGLGYYNRALNLHRAAKLSAPTLPDSVEALMALPGIGRNTAHAIAAFAFRQPVPVLEANVKRVIARVFALDTPSEKALWEKAEALLDRDDPFTHNQAMMDIGAGVCTPKAPLCAFCPLNAVCEGKVSPERYPAPKQARKVPVRKRLIIVPQTADGLLFMAPRRTRFLNGLYGFPEYEREEGQGRVASLLANGGELVLKGKVAQTYSHFQLDGEVRYVTGVPATAFQHGDWRWPEEWLSYPMSRADEKVMQLIEADKRKAA